MKKIKVAGAAGLALLLVVLIMIWANPSKTIYITTAMVKTSGLVNDIDYSGTINAQQNAPVVSDIGGRVTSVVALLGQTVKKDDVLFTVDSTDIALQYNQVQANFQVAQANYEKISNGTVKESEMQLRQTLQKAENELRDAAASYQLIKEQYDNNTAIASAQAALDMAKSDYDTTAALFEMGAESQNSLNTAKSKMDSAAAQLEIAKASAQTTLNNADSRLHNAQIALSNAQQDLELGVNTLNPESIKSAEAQRDSAQAALDIVRRKLDGTAVKAPADGQVAMSSIKAGDIIAPQSPVMMINSTDQMEMTLQVTERVISQVTVGMPVHITLLGSGQTLEGKVTAAAAAINEKTGLTDVKVSIDNADKKLKAGMLAKARLIPTDESRKIYVPVKAVLSADSNPYIFIIENNTIKKVSIVLGEKRYAYVEVTSGLAADAQVVVEGNTNAYENGPFQIVKSVS